MSTCEPDCLICEAERRSNERVVQRRAAEREVNRPRPGDLVDIAPNQTARPGNFGVRVGRVVRGDAYLAGWVWLRASGALMCVNESDLTVIKRADAPGEDAR